MLAVSPGMNVNGMNLVTLSFKHRYNTETCCDHGYVVYRLNGGPWQYFVPETSPYNVYDFMYNDPIFGGCGFSPDTLVYAGDSDGYTTSTGTIDVSGAAGLQVAFFFSSDASFVDDGWYLDDVRVVSTSSCPSGRSPGTVYVSSAPEEPTIANLDLCADHTAILDASSNSSAPNPVFEWYDAAIGGNLLHLGNPYIFNPVVNTAVYVQELSQAQRSWNFDEDLEGWTATGECGLDGTWVWNDDAGAGAVFAQQTGSGNSSMILRSPPIQVQGSDIVDMTFTHRYNTETCCDHGYVVYRLDGGDWDYLPTNNYSILDFLYNDPILGDCGFSPDTLCYAGDSGGYITSSATIAIEGGSMLEVGFFFSTDASFVDEGWYINAVSLNGVSLFDCPTERVPVLVKFPTLIAPSTSGDNICPPEPGVLTAKSNSGTTAPRFEWYDSPAGGNLLFTGKNYIPNAPPVATTTYYVQEVLAGEKIWSFDSDANGWTTANNCAIPGTWVWNDDGGEGAMFARQTGSGNSSMSLISPVIDVSGDKNDVTVNFRHRYNTETCCDHGYVLYRLDAGPWQYFEPGVNPYDVYDFMYNDPYFGGCGFSPDTLVYAGDSEGYVNSSGVIDVATASTLQVLFFFSSDASFVDEGWYIDEVGITDLVAPCSSPRTPAILTISSVVSPPSVDDRDICPGLVTELLATSNSALNDDVMTFKWYDAPIGGTLLSSENPYAVSPLATTTYYVEETSIGNIVYNFNGDMSGWNATAECGLSGTWVNVNDAGRQTLFAQQQGSGNSSMLITSPVIPLNGQFAISYNFTHRYNTETCCDHGYVIARRNGGAWFQLTPTTNGYNVFDFMYNDPIFGDCGFSPDMNLFAGDSGDYLNSSGALFTSGSSTVQFGFLFSSDASFVDDGWYIDEFVVNGIYSGCTSDRTPVTVTVEGLTPPDVNTGSTCSGGSTTLMAASTNNVAGTTFDWYDAMNGGNLLYTGNPFFTPPVVSATNFYVEEVIKSPLNLTDNFDGGFDGAIWSSVQAATADIVCGSVSGDGLRFNGAGTRIAWINPIDVTFGGTIAFSLKISQEITAGCEAAEAGEDVVLEYSIGGPYTIMATYNENGYADFTEIVEPIPPAAISANTIFRWRQLSNSGLDFDVWVIDDLSISAISANTCMSSRTIAPVTIDDISAPSASGDDEVCNGEVATLVASSNSGLPNPVFEWYSSAIGGSLLQVGQVFNPTPSSNTTYHLQERNRGNRFWNFTNDLEDWTATAECGLPFNWNWDSDHGVGAAFATNPSSGNSSMLLQSPVVNVAGATTVNFSMSHRYNTETCCDHGYIIYRVDGGAWQMFQPTTNPYNIFDFMYNDPIFGGCGFSPDTTVFAGDSGGYLTSAGEINVEGNAFLEIAFLWTSDASFKDDGWYINSVQITGLGSGCTSERTPVPVTVGLPQTPSVAPENVCLGGRATLTAVSNSTNLVPLLEWYDAQFGGSLLGTGADFETPQNFFPSQSFWVQETVPGVDVDWSDDFDGGIEPALWALIQNGQTNIICGAVSGDALHFDGLGTRAATTIPLDLESGMLSFDLLISQQVTAGCEAAEPGEGVVLEYSTGGAFFVLQSFANNAYPAFANVQVDIPPAALSNTTTFRIGQLSNSGLGFDNWAIDNFSVSGTSFDICKSQRAEGIVLTTPLAGPSVPDETDVLPGSLVTLTATSNTAIPFPDFEWYTEPSGGDPVFIGNPLSFVATQDTTLYVQERDRYQYNWTFDNDFEGWLESTGCALPVNTWEYNPDGGAGTLYASNPNSGNSSMLLRSPFMNVSNTTNAQFSFSHRYNTETCCDHGYVVYRLNGGPWQMFMPTTNPYNIYDFMYNDPILGGCGFSPDTTVYAGDSGGFLTSSGSINTTGASSLQVGFLYTTDASFTDDGWYINSVNVAMAGTGCISERVGVDVVLCGPHVISTADAGAGTLRRAIECAEPGDTITFGPALVGQSILLATPIILGKHIDIYANPLDQITISGENTTVAMAVAQGIETKWTGLHIISGSFSQGAAILNTGSLTLESIRISIGPNAPPGQIPVYNANILFAKSEVEIMN